jgi:hypothetical protein
MAKKSSTEPKKPALSLAELTGDVAAFSITGGTTPKKGASPNDQTTNPPQKQPHDSEQLEDERKGEKAVPASALPITAEETAPVAPAPEPVASTPTPEPVVAAALSELPAVPMPEPIASATTPIPMEEPEAAATDRVGEASKNKTDNSSKSHPDLRPTVEAGSLNLAALFSPSPTKKETMLRITADNKEFFTNLGFALGNGATAPEIIHNILTQFRQQHEAELQKLIRKGIQKKFS